MLRAFLSQATVLSNLLKINLSKACISLLSLLVPVSLADLVHRAENRGLSLALCTFACVFNSLLQELL